MLLRVNTNLAVRLSKGATHSTGETIGTSARQLLVDAQHVVRVQSDTHVEAVLAAILHKGLVARNTGGLERLG